MYIRAVFCLLYCLLLMTKVVGEEADDQTTDCRDVHLIREEERCSFTKNSSCINDEGFVNYVAVVYCHFKGDLVYLGTFLHILWWLILFIGLAVTADSFFCPALTVIAKVTRMSDNIAGVTLLAFGNGAPDIFSAIAAIGSIKNGDAGLAFGALLGAGVFVTAVVSGAVIISKPFQCMERPLLRDITFYLVAVFFTFYIMYNREIRTLHAISFLLVYVAYVIVVVLGRYIRVKFQNQSLISSNTMYSPVLQVTPAPTTEEPATHANGIDTDMEQLLNASVAEKADKDPDLASTCGKFYAYEVSHNDEQRTSHHGHLRVSLSSSVNRKEESLAYEESYEETPLLQRSIQVITPRNNCGMFLDAINPICKKDWQSKNWFGKILLIAKAPVRFLLTITCPVVDYDCENNNWNRYLTGVQLMLGTMFSIFAVNQFDVKLGGHFPLWALFLLISIILAALSFFFSSNDEPPKWHPALAFFGFVVAVIWIYCIANEIVNLLQLFGVVLKLSDAVLGLTLLAWGNSISDLIADTTLARKGYPRIGISACFGGPMFNLLLGVGIPFTIGCLKNEGVMKLDFNFLQLVLIGSLALSLLCSFVIPTFLLKFYMKRWYGIFLIILYFVFLITAILTEYKVLHVDVTNW